ncbi:hypothetical protein BDV95DRAFT_610299 [Massariosphaeria phaeospora]|uniref:F-box domain-containing protein n=1 Tax=Massariosphaeria phaeospora TaxID=100035 RepID=A0A7C8M4A4_9PLEO|nr:hypothetical protein BDV95DRAFT_610299 [Massariosphaeria phaeospora]
MAPSSRYNEGEERPRIKHRIKLRSSPPEEAAIITASEPTTNFDRKPHPVLQTSSCSRLNQATSTLIGLPYEMLEAILLQLPIQDLLLCQSVCRAFGEMVSSSRPLRRALFLEPAHYSGKLSEWKLLKWNPFLETKLSNALSIRVMGVHRSAEGPVKMVAHVRFRKDEVDGLNMLLHDQASWKQMLVTQPPVTLLMHPSASLFWKSSMEHQAQFFHEPMGFSIMDMVSCVDW